MCKAQCSMLITTVCGDSRDSKRLGSSGMAVGAVVVRREDAIFPTKENIFLL